MNHKLSYKIQNYRAQRVLLNTAYILGTLGLGFVQGDQVLDSPMLTDFGAWGRWEFCPEGTYATGMQLYTQQSQGFFKDDRGLTGIRLFCNPFGEKTTSHEIKSSVDNVGDWGNEYFCQGLMTGFQLRTEKYRHWFIDDTATNNVRMFCDHNDSSFAKGDGTAFGTWTEARFCSNHEAICGIKTQIDTDFSFDKTGLNNLLMKCCDIPHPVRNCIPKTRWEKVVTCEAPLTQDRSCNYTRKVGVSYMDSYAKLVALHQFGGYVLREIMGEFQSRFHNEPSYVSVELTQENSEDFYWKLSPSFIWQPEDLLKSEISAAKGTKVTLYQMHGKCGMLQIWGARMKTIEYDTRSNHNETNYADFAPENEIEPFP